jgi:hypothetical protein
MHYITTPYYTHRREAAAFSGAQSGGLTRDSRLQKTPSAIAAEGVSGLPKNLIYNIIPVSDENII